MAEKGLVTNIKDNYAVVRLTRQEACAKCRACIAGMSEQDMFIEAENACNAEIGDWVYVDLRDNGFLNAVLIMYGIPLIGLLAGILIGYFAISPALGFDGNTKDIFSFFCGIICTLLAYLWIKLNDKKWKNDKKYRPVAIGVTEPDEKSKSCESK